MSESMREAVEGFERNPPACECGAEHRPDGWQHTSECVLTQTRASYPEWHKRQVARYGEDANPRATIAAHRALLGSITRADILDLATDANDARQRAILYPHTADDELARAARVEDLAERLSRLMPNDLS